MTNFKGLWELTTKIESPLFLSFEIMRSTSNLLNTGQSLHISSINFTFVADTGLMMHTVLFVEQ